MYLSRDFDLFASQNEKKINWYINAEEVDIA